MVKLLKRVRYLCASKNKGGQQIGLRAQRTQTVQRHSKQNIKLTEDEGNIFLKPKDDERMASGWMTVWRLDTGRLKRFGRTQSRWWKQQVQLGGDITKESEEMQIEALKEATRS